MDAQHISDAKIIVTESNYTDIVAYIENQVDQFLINSESWTLSLFRKMSRSPTPESIRQLEQWINEYLSMRAIRELRAKFAGDINLK